MCGLVTPCSSNCPYCNGSGEVIGVVDDIGFSFDCVCQGGDAEAVLWLLGYPPPSADDYSI
jgi:hypothetical protein